MLGLGSGSAGFVMLDVVLLRGEVLQAPLNDFDERWESACSERLCQNSFLECVTTNQDILIQDYFIFC